MYVNKDCLPGAENNVFVNIFPTGPPAPPPRPLARAPAAPAPGRKGAAASRRQHESLLPSGF